MFNLNTINDDLDYNLYGWSRFDALWCDDKTGMFDVMIGQGCDDRSGM